jgi:secreted trypsin-like serine protease
MKRLVILGVVAAVCIAPSIATARSSRQVRPDIAGGFTPAATSWPWTTAIQLQGSPWANCTATLIAPKRLLTASHCVFDESSGNPIPPNEWDVYINRRDTSSLLGEHRKVTAVVSHPSFTGFGTADYDVAVMFLDAPVTDVSPVPLGTSSDWGQEYAATGCGLNNYAEACYEGVATGWGHTNYDHANPVHPTQIQAGVLTLGSDAYCKFLIDGRSVNSYDSNTQFCAYDPHGTTCITHGDSGGPFMVLVNGEWRQTGVASHYPSPTLQWGSCQGGTNVIAETWVAGPTIRNWITSVTNPECPGAETQLTSAEASVTGAKAWVTRAQAGVSRASKRVRRLQRLRRRPHGYARALRNARRKRTKARRNLRAARSDVISTSVAFGNASNWTSVVCTG